MRIGDVEVYVVSDGLFMMDGGAAFGLVPRVLWERYVQPDDLNRIPMALNCLLIRSQGKIILVDTGYGDKLSPKRIEQLSLHRNGGLIAALARHNVAPEEVNIVINTHLHADHCGGNTTIRQGVLGPTFPNAEYWIQQREWEEANNPNERTRATYLAENITPIAPQVRLLQGDTPITSEVRCVITRGHTRSHQSVIIESQGQTAIYLGEVAPFTVNLERLAWIAAFDTEPLFSLETKKRIREWAVETGALLLFNHDPDCPVGYLRRRGLRYKVHPLT